MIHLLLDHYYITLGFLGTILNVLGLAIPLILCLAIVSTYHERYFRFWTLSYLMFLLAVLGDAAIAPERAPSLLAWAVVTVHLVGTAFLFATADALTGKPVPRKWLYAVTLSAVALTGAMFMAGQSFMYAATPSIILNVLGHLRVGVTLIGNSWPSPQAGRMLGLWTIITGVWVFMFPVLMPWRVVWLGSCVAGVNHVVIGVGMAVFVIENAAIQLRAQNEELKELDRLKTDFLATVSHELRTPLTVIKTSAWLLGEERLGPLNPEQQEVALTLSAHTESLILLINDLLDLSKLEAGKLLFRLMPGDLAALARTVTARYASLFDEKAITLAIDAPSPVTAPYDSTRIQQVLGNLLTNAAKFTPFGGQVAVSVQAVGEFARITVADSGIGIAPEQFAKIFDKFYQVDSSGTRQVGGSGLGLAICRAMVEDGHGGRIGVESTLGQGSIFTVTLPLHQGAAPHESSISKSQATDTAGAPWDSERHRRGVGH